MKVLTKQDEFLDAIINKYLKSNSGQSTEVAGVYQPCLREAAARLLLAIMPGLDALSIFSEKVVLALL